MSRAEMTSDSATGMPTAGLDQKLEVMVIPVSDVDRATHFYLNLGWRQDGTPPGSGIVQLTPHGSDSSVQFGGNLTSAAPGSAKGYLVVSDIVAARDALVAAGIDVSDVSHLGPDGPLSGPDPERRSYFSRATFSDPDGNEWLLQEITTRLPGRVDATATSFGSASDLASALRRAEAAHGEHEKRTGERDEDWPSWYAAYMVAEQSGAELPT
jgi:catechol 2,3-dioxygenase-like lactoylglutathione lyase family enzyme